MNQILALDKLLKGWSAIKQINQTINLPKLAFKGVYL